MTEELDLIELFLQQDAELKRLFEALPAMKQELNGELRIHLDRIGAENAESAKGIIAGALSEAQTNLMRLARNELGSIALEAKKGLEGVTQTQEQVVKLQGERLQEIEAGIPRKLKTILDRAFAEKRKEFERQNQDHVVKTMAAAQKASFFDWFRGNWNKETLYKRGEIFAFRGSCYIVEREVVGQFPTQQNQKGGDKLYSIIAAAGSPGPIGQPGLNTAVNSVAGTANQINASASTGAITLTLSSTMILPGTLRVNSALTYGGVTLSNAVTGTGNMVLSASPTFTGTVASAGIVATLAGGSGLTTRSGASGSFAGVSVGRTADEWSLYVSSGANVGAQGAVAGDGVLRGNQVLFLDTSQGVSTPAVKILAGLSGMTINAPLTLAGALTSTGLLTATTGVTTGAGVTNAAGTWKLGALRTGVALTPSTTNVIQVDIGGTLYSLITCSTNP